MNKETIKFLDSMDYMPLKTGHIHMFTGVPGNGKTVIVKDWDMNQKPVNQDENPFENLERAVIENKNKPVVLPRKSKLTFNESKFEVTPKEIPTVKQIILGNVPSKSNCYKIITFKSKDPDKSHASLGKTKALKQYENDFFIQANRYRNLNVDEYFEFEIDVYYPTQRSDLDNSLKVVLDCLQKINAIKNDNKCTRIVANKFLDKNNPRIEFIIRKSM